MKSNNNLKFNNEWKINMNIESKFITLTLINKDKNKISKKIKRTEIKTSNAHTIGRSLENEYNKKYNVIIEPYNISKIIGLVNNVIKTKLENHQ